MKKENVGMLLKVVREDAGLSLENVATAGGYSPSYLSKVESGKKDATIPILNLYAAETGNAAIGLVAANIDLQDLLDSFKRGVRKDFAVEVIHSA